MSYYLGIDVSTTATKALLIDEGGRVVAVAASAYTVTAPRPLWSEQDPTLWWGGAGESTRAVLKASGVPADQVRGIGLTGQMHGLVLQDRAGEVLRPALLWNDQRTGSQCDEIRARLGRERLIQITGNDALTGFTAPKILWVQQEEPDIYRRVAHILMPHDYVRYKLSEQFAVDRAGGAGTLLFDLRARTWSKEVLDALEIDAALLPETFEGTDVTGTLSAAAAALTGLVAGTPIVGGGGDQAAAAIGTGAVEEGIVSLSLGTSGVVFAATDQPTIEPEGRLHAFCHAVPGKWHLMGVMLSAGGSLRWHRDTQAAGVPFDDLLKPAADIAPGSDGLLFLPYLTGERSPYPDPLARGAFVGLTVQHDRRHLTRAVLEGVAFGLRDGLDLMLAAGMRRPSQIRASGGGLASDVWRQILADVLDAELVSTSTTEGAAFGAAVLAATGAGWYRDVPSAAAALVRTSHAASPGAARSAYATAHAAYRELYPALTPTFHRGQP